MKKTTKMKACAIALSAVLALSGGCSLSEDEYKNSDEDTIKIESNIEESSNKVEMNENYVEPQTNIFNSGEHVVHQHIYFNNGYRSSIDKENESYLSQIKIPNGYQFVDSENYIQKAGYGSQTTGRDYYYVNIVPVEVTSTKLDENGEYIFDSFGTPVEQEQVLSKTQE